jgi:hypothetical protein
MVEGLLAKKAGVMPWPAAIITAVGTKVGRVIPALPAVKARQQQHGFLTGNVRQQLFCIASSRMVRGCCWCVL